MIVIYIINCNNSFTVRICEAGCIQAPAYEFCFIYEQTHECVFTKAAECLFIFVKVLFFLCFFFQYR